MVVHKTCDMISSLLLNRQEFPGRCTLTDQCRITVVWQKTLIIFLGICKRNIGFLYLICCGKILRMFSSSVIQLKTDRQTDGQTDWRFLHTYTAKHWHLWAVTLLKTAMNFKLWCLNLRSCEWNGVVGTKDTGMTIISMFNWWSWKY